MKWTLLLLNVTEDVNDIHIGLNNKAFIFFNKKISQVYSVDRKDSTKAPLIEGENIDFARYLNDYIVYSQGEDYSVLYFYDLPTGKIKKVNRPWVKQSQHIFMTIGSSTVL